MEQARRTPRLVEAAFPFIELSHLVAADRRGRDPVYAVHKWFARRPPTLVRALLLASHINASPAADVPATDSLSTFWGRFNQAGRWLENAVVYDPFMGGGTSLVESARMGAHVVGRDVDPIAVAVVGSELAGPGAEFEDESTKLFTFLAEQFADAFAATDEDWTPLHWFWLMAPTCTSCGDPGLLYRDLIIATSSGRTGSVVRDDAMHAFCPDCLRVHALGPGRAELRCCGRRRQLKAGTYRAGRYHCTSCGHAATYEDLQAANAERVMVAVEETHATLHRRIRTATNDDRQRVGSTSMRVNSNPSEHGDAGADNADAGPADHSTDPSDIYDVLLATERRDRRPVSAGFTSSRTMFTPRQWSVFTTAFAHVCAAGHPQNLERDLTLMLTGALSSNNILCGYAREYGRLAPLFSVRGFSIPALSVELNPFHPTAGRGTLRSAKVRLADRNRTTVRRARLTAAASIGDATIRPERAIHEPSTAKPIEYASIDLPVMPASVNLMCASADDTAGQNHPLATVCVTDPPYFDYIAYSELSEFFRTWLRAPGLGGVPLLPQNARAVESFAEGLGAALKATVARLAPDTPLVFTYHSSNADAWRAIGDAFDIADLSVVALWPVLADPHMGHHAASGNCEWDLIVVARRHTEATPIDDVDGLDAPGQPPTQVTAPLVVAPLDHYTRWIAAIEGAGLDVGVADQANFRHAWAMANRHVVSHADSPTEEPNPIDVSAADRASSGPARKRRHDPARQTSM